MVKKGDIMLKIDMKYNNNILYVDLDGLLTRKTSYKINNYLLPVILKHNIKCMVYNLSRIKTIDEFGIDAILNTKYAIKNNRGNIYLSSKSTNKNIKKLKIKYKLIEV